ncbi:MAG: histidine--tRNA ligase [Gemmatimonas sp.]|uniref:histidine--tRNA ligase n=1 Tax=Gemmatimonas sp. TaxID=1962908 RepID=UPI00391FBF3B
MSHKPLPGFRDFFPEQFAERAHLFDTWRRIVRRYAFQEYDGPPLEPLELYTQKSGDEIVTQLYNFVDKGDRPVALRPEMTPTLARMVGARAQALRKPVRWFSIPQLFRYERTQKGRLREHYQLNVDIVGEADVLADAELLSVAIEIMSALGLTDQDVRARVSDRRLLNGLLEHLMIPEASWPAVYAVLDKLERQPRDVSAGKLAEAGLEAATQDVVLGFGTVDFATLRARYAEAPAVKPHLDRFAEYLGHLDALGVGSWIRFDLTIVRGLAYYTGIVFELFDRIGEFRAICGGGRYDTLLRSLGGTDQPALGFGMGDVVLGELLRARGLMPSSGSVVQFWVAQAPGPANAPAAALQTATALRHTGAVVEHALRPMKLDKQLEAGRKAGAAAFVIVDPSATDAPWRVRRSGHDDQMFATLDALCAWASPLTGSAS